MPSVTGLTRAEAEARLQNAGLQVGTVSEASSQDVPDGRVISQDPQDSTQVDRDTEVDFVLSNGKPQVTLPDVVGQGKNAAAQQLRASGLRVVLTERDTDDPKDEVVEMQPPAGTKVADGSKVTLFYADGPEQVPSVKGKTEAEATRLIEAAGFKVSKVEDSSTPATKGTVLQQSPDAGHHPRQGQHGHHRGLDLLHTDALAVAVTTDDLATHPDSDALTPHPARAGSADGSSVSTYSTPTPSPSPSPPTISPPTPTATP